MSGSRPWKPALLLAAAGLAGCLSASRPPKAPQRPVEVQASAQKEKGLFAVLKTGKGDIELRLLPKEVPKTVENFLALAQGRKEWTDPLTGQKTSRPLYDGSLFFRVIPGFVIQAGDPAGEGWGGPGYAMPEEPFPGRTFDRPGLVAMAGSGAQTSGSQFFITLAPAPWLKNVVFGEVVGGLDVVEAIGAAPRTHLDPASGREIDRPNEPTRILRVLVEDRK